MKDKINSLEGLKIICFVMVFGWHTYDLCNFLGVEYAFRAVSFFMILSGFFITLHHSSKICVSNFKDHLKFVNKKIKKFYPLCAIGLFLVVIQMNFDQIKDSFGEILKHALLLQSLFTKNYFLFNGSAWFLSTLIIMYLFSFFMLKMIKPIKNSLKKLLIGLSVTYFILYIYILLARNLGLNAEYWVYVCPIFHIFQYTMGCFTAHIYMNLLKTEIKINNNKKINKCVFTLIDAIVLVLYILTIKNIFKLDEYSFRQFYHILFNIILILWFSLSKGYISELLGCKFMRYLGTMGFSFYIIHMPLLFYASKFNFLKLQGKWFVVYYALLVFLFVFAYEFVRKKVTKSE